jgi:hypothetical protein
MINLQDGLVEDDGVVGLVLNLSLGPLLLLTRTVSRVLIVHVLLLLPPPALDREM